VLHNCSLPPSPSEELIADKAYDADHLRAFLQARGTLVVIPNKANRVTLYPFDAEKHKQCHRAQHRPDQGLPRDRHSLSQDGSQFPRRYLSGRRHQSGGSIEVGP
jgi:hypothetical protein